jgi:hypothetical protein
MKCEKLCHDPTNSIVLVTSSHTGNRRRAPPTLRVTPSRACPATISQQDPPSRPSPRASTRRTDYHQPPPRRTDANYLCMTRTPSCADREGDTSPRWTPTGLLMSATPPSRPRPFHPHFPFLPVHDSPSLCDGDPLSDCLDPFM